MAWFDSGWAHSRRVDLAASDVCKTLPARSDSAARLRLFASAEDSKRSSKAHWVGSIPTGSTTPHSTSGEVVGFSKPIRWARYPYAVPGPCGRIRRPCYERGSRWFESTPQVSAALGAGPTADLRCGTGSYQSGRWVRHPSGGQRGTNESEAGQVVSRLPHTQQMAGSIPALRTVAVRLRRTAQTREESDEDAITYG